MSEYFTGDFVLEKPHIISDWVINEALDRPYKFSGFPVVHRNILGAGYCILRLVLGAAPDDLEAAGRVCVQLAGEVLFNGPVHGEATLGFVLPRKNLGKLHRATLSVDQVASNSPPPIRLLTMQLVWAPAVRDRLSLQGLADMDARTVAMQFQSLGDNCEFGLFQRHVGAEPLGLLRFASTRLDKLLIGLSEGFVGFDLPDQIETYLFGDTARREYVTQHMDYGMISHTDVYEGDMTENEVHAREATRLRYLRRRFVEDLEDAEKIYVIRRDPPLSEHEVVPIWLALREFGPNSLLCVAPATEGHAAGSMEEIATGLMMGYVDRLAPYYDAHDVSDDSWLELCRSVLTRHHSVAGMKNRLKRLWLLAAGRLHNALQNLGLAGGRR